MLRAHSFLLGGLVVVLAACGSSGRDGFSENDLNGPAADPNGTPGDGDTTSGDFGGPASTGGVTLDPKNTTVIIDSATNPATPGTVSYKVLQSGKDLTATATFTMKDASLGSFTGATFKSIAALPAGVMGKSTTISAATSGGSALGTLTVVQLRKTGPQRDFFFVVPYGEDPDPKSDVLKFSTNIKQADVAFAMDTTFSMSGAINALKAAIKGTLLADLQTAIPNVGLAIVDYRDYPTTPYGLPGTDFPVKVHQKITTTLSLAQAGVDKYALGDGYDLPESQIPAMQHILTGEALLTGGASVAAVAPSSPGAWGGVEFRPGSVPVVVNVTDINWHGEGNTPYPFATPTMASLKAAFVAKKAFFVNVTQTGADESQANALSDASGSNVTPADFGGGCTAGQCCTGLSGAARAPSAPGGKCRLNFLHNSGGGLGNSIVKAISAIAVGTTFDVKAIAANDPTNKGGVDATKFIKALRAMDEGNPANGCPAAAAKDSDGDGIKDTFTAVKAGTPVCFEVIPNKNTIVPPDVDPQFFNAFVNVIGVQGNLPLDKRSVLFLVPPKDPGVK